MEFVYDGINPSRFLNGVLTISGSAMLRPDHNYLQSVQNYPKIRVRAKEEFRLLGGHLWAFSNELLDIPKDLPAGSVVTLVREKDGFPIAHAFFNPHSLIAARILAHDTRESIDEAFFEQRLRQSAARREMLLQRRNAVRLVHGESDFLPGLIIDKFADIISYQALSAGFEARKDLIIGLIQKLWNPKSIIEKNNSHLRSLEGLPQIEQFVFGTETETEIHDIAGTRFRIDALSGQKTGFFLDQMENRTRLRDFIRTGSRVLDLFSNEGGFALNTALAGASSVLAVDASESALAKVSFNAKLNGVEDRISTLTTDCFQFVREATEQYDVIIVDPPALAKSRKDTAAARKGYIALNSGAMKLLRPGGILLTASCSHHISRDDFFDILRESGRRAKRTVSILEERAAAQDHPVLAAMSETSYLKCFILGIG